jgi:hypothetical protein
MDWKSDIIFESTILGAENIIGHLDLCHKTETFRKPLDQIKTINCHFTTTQHKLSLPTINMLSISIDKYYTVKNYTPPPPHIHPQPQAHETQATHKPFFLFHMNILRSDRNIQLSKCFDKCTSELT